MCFEPALKGILVLVHVTKVCLQLVRMRNIVVALIELFWKKKGMLMIVGTHTALGNAYTIYSSTYTRVPVPYIYIQNTMHSVQ